MMKRRRRQIGRLLFFVPVIVVIALVILALIFVNTGGTLTVTAETSGRYYAPFYLRPEATVGTTTRTAPFNLSLQAGSYTVTFGSILGFVTPPGEDITVLPGKTAFATGVYEPIAIVVLVTGSGFNATRVDAIHDVTPVVWENQQSVYVVLNIQPTGRVVIPAGGNYTHVFTQPGSYNYAYFFNQSGGTPSGTVAVS